ncbi:unnamed protein product [Protopolystoma xenopodis]|uniref:ZZ-type domain-containing protein n=1 Tax=Protopolystoma xenopodis TaxID=117903 RepID=A0A3S5ANT7_9PLAT|nr:unnamed protein product [Protopolystoma xenopodis]
MEEWHRKSGLPLKMEVRRSKRPEKIYRLNKTLMIDSCSKPNETNASFMHINASGDNRHFGIVCDGCNKHDFAGDRFKCLDCQNFDLCLACFSSGIHKDHDMLALRTPSWIKKSIYISSSGSRKPSAPESIGSVAYSLRDASTSSNDLISAKVSPFNETSDESSITVHDSDGSSMFSDDRNDPTPDWEVVEANGDGHSESVRAPQANLDVPIQEPPVPSGDLSDMHISEPLLASLTPDTLCDASPSNQQNDQHNPIDTNSRSSTSLPDSNLDGHPRMDSTQRPFEMNLITGNLLLPVLESARQAVNLVDDITIQGLGLSSPPPSASPTPSLLRINNLQSLRDMGFEASRGQSFLNRVLDEVNDNLASATDRCLSGN